MSARIFGHIAGHPPGSIFADRKELSISGVHRPPQSGISGSSQEGADSIVISGGYEDDKDHGDVIIYTGAGGRDGNTGKQYKHQTLTNQNLALAKNVALGYPVRVSRLIEEGTGKNKKRFYQYDGLYWVTQYWDEIGKSGFTIWRYRLERIEPTSPEGTSSAAEASTLPPGRASITYDRLKRNVKLVERVKEIYKNTCQVCGIQLSTALGTYAEAAHIQPLGKPHNGMDTLSNLLCLCPNHHKQLDHFAFSIADDLSLIGMEGKIMVKKPHQLNSEVLGYHRKRYEVATRKGEIH